VDESKNPNSDVWQMMLKLFCLLQGHRKFNYFFFYFWLCLLFCMLLWSDLGELVLMMERDPCCSIDNLDGECESRFLELIAVKVSKEWKEVNMQQLYEAGLGEGEAWIFLLGSGRN
jgi:hypothetical protein